MNNQEAFTKVVLHARKQGCKSIDGYDNCLYRGLKSKSNSCVSKCFIGALIPDEEYSGNFEGKGLPTLVATSNIQSLIGLDASMLNDLQHLHDKYDVEDWETGFKTIAKEFDLVVPTL